MKFDNLPERYARAFLGAYKESALGAPEHLKNFYEFLKDSRMLLIVLQLPSLVDEKKDRVIDAVVKHFQLGAPFARLMHHLVHRRRIALLDKIIKHINLYRIRAGGAEVFSVTSSHELTSSQQAALERSLEQLAGKPVEATFAIDEDLICGIKAISETLAWERSVRKTLRHIKKELVQETIA